GASGGSFRRHARSLHSLASLPYIGLQTIPEHFEGAAMQWFFGLPIKTIHTFNNLATHFVSQFATNKAKRLEVANLFYIK
ncbi:hypothetical protein CR513_31293, partial [Mucuna pruriens]